MLPFPDGKRIHKDSHKIRHEQMDQDALKVVRRLSQSGYRAYLVGGCVRDMLLNFLPKDFDVVTSATPRQICRVFSNSRTIGRRFKIVHVIQRSKIIEVSTFRGLPPHRLSRNKRKSYYMTRDNRFGSPQEDAARRDFTINGLYFDAKNDSIIDYVGGFDDIFAKKIRSIGDPNISFQEDPIRMFRAAKFAAILDFDLEGKTIRSVRSNKDEIRKSNQSRLYDELMKVFRTGKSALIFRSLYKLDLLASMMPSVYAASSFKEGDLFERSSLGMRLALADKTLSEFEELTSNIFLSLLLLDLARASSKNKHITSRTDQLRSRLSLVCREMAVPVRDRERLVQMYAAQSKFAADPAKRKFL